MPAQRPAGEARGGAPVTRPTVALYQVEQILQGARRQGRDVPALLRRSGIPPALLGTPLARISQTQYAALMRTLRRVTRDELWGLCSRPVPLGAFAVSCRQLVHCRTLGEALREGLRFWSLLIDDFSGRLQVADGVATVRLRPRVQAADACLAYAQRVFLFMGLGLACWLVARRIPLLHVDYCNDAADEGSDAYRLFQAPMRYGQSAYALHFEARWLELPVVQSRQSLGEFLRQAPAALVVRYRDQTSVTERIRRLLRRRLDQELPSLEEVGRALAISPQTLRRRLREEGLGFQALKDDLRRDAAIEYLARPELTVLEIAAMLGFSEPSAFHRAFRRWTGLAPGEYRIARRAAVPPASGQAASSA